MARITVISIHALREEGDGLLPCCPFSTKNFYPRPPRGGRPEGLTYRSTLDVFLSTPSVRRATVVARVQKADITISIHALREEGDVQPYEYGHPYSKFLSTPSVRRATIKP